MIFHGHVDYVEQACVFAFRLHKFNINFSVHFCMTLMNEVIHNKPIKLLFSFAVKNSKKNFKKELKDLS